MLNGRKALCMYCGYTFMSYHSVWAKDKDKCVACKDTNLKYLKEKDEAKGNVFGYPEIEDDSDSGDLYDNKYLVGTD